MSQFVSVCHGGARYLLPAEQVVAARLDAADLAALSLGFGIDAGAPEGEGERDLVVHTGEGERHWRCHDIRLVEVDDAQVWELPQLTRDLLGAPRVTAVAQLGADLMWVLDLRRVA